MKAGKNLKHGLLACALSAALLWFGNNLEPVWWMMWIAPLPILWFSLRSQWMGAAAVAFFAWLLGCMNLLSYFERLGMPFRVWGLNFGGLSLLAALGVLLFRWLMLRGRPWSAIIAIPALTVSVDWLRNWITPHGTAADLAYTQLKDLPFLQLASLTGPWGMSFVVLLVPCAVVAYAWLRERDGKAATRLATVVGALLAAIFIFGSARLMHPAPGPVVRVGLVVSDAKENDDIAEGINAERLLKLYAQQAMMLAAQGAKAVVLPEKIAVVLDTDQALSDRVFQPVADEQGVIIVAGELYITSTPTGKLSYNRAQIYRPNLKSVSYDKEHMLPPFESNLTVGTEKITLPAQGAPWGVSICKDMDFTSMGRAYSRMGAGMLLVPAWDFNADRTWHGKMSLMRGVEGGFSVVRAAKNSWLFASDDRGRVLGQVRTDAAPFATLLVDVPTDHDETLASKWGDWFAWLAVALLAWVLVRVVMPARRQH